MQMTRMSQGRPLFDVPDEKKLEIKKEIESVDGVSYVDYDESENYNGEAPTYGAKGVTLSSDEIYTLASVIEKEASTPEDMQRVSAVFYNRLAANMRLQSDPTAKYLSGITNISLTSAQTNRSSPYNTYVVDGLPLGPICSPGTAASILK